MSPEEIKSLRLSPEEGFVLSRIDGNYDIESILKISPMPPLEAQLVFRKLLHAGHIELLQALLSEFGMPIYKKKKVLLLDTLLVRHEPGAPERQHRGSRREPLESHRLPPAPHKRLDRPGGGGLNTKREVRHQQGAASLE